MTANQDALFVLPRDLPAVDLDAVLAGVPDQLRAPVDGQLAIDDDEGEGS